MLDADNFDVIGYAEIFRPRGLQPDAQYNAMH